jgi:hypothetical protein
VPGGARMSRGDRGDDWSKERNVPGGALKVRGQPCGDDRELETCCESQLVTHLGQLVASVKSRSVLP